MKTVAKIIIRDRDSRILVLTRGESHPKFAKHLDFPGGEVELNESSKSGIIREVREETSLVLNASKIKLLFKKKVHFGLTHLLYSYQLNEVEPVLTISWEHSLYEWVDKHKLLKQKIPLKVDPYYREVINYLNRS